MNPTLPNKPKLQIIERIFQKNLPLVPYRYFQDQNMLEVMAHLRSSTIKKIINFQRLDKVIQMFLQKFIGNSDKLCIFMDLYSIVLQQSDNLMTVVKHIQLIDQKIQRHSNNVEVLNKYIKFKMSIALKMKYSRYLFQQVVCNCQHLYYHNLISVMALFIQIPTLYNEPLHQNRNHKNLVHKLFQVFTLRIEQVLDQMFKSQQQIQPLMFREFILNLIYKIKDNAREIHSHPFLKHTYSLLIRNHEFGSKILRILKKMNLHGVMHLWLDLLAKQQEFQFVKRELINYMCNYSAQIHQLDIIVFLDKNHDFAHYWAQDLRKKRFSQFLLFLNEDSIMFELMNDLLLYTSFQSEQELLPIIYSQHYKQTARKFQHIERPYIYTKVLAQTFCNQPQLVLNQIYGVYNS